MMSLDDGSFVLVHILDRLRREGDTHEAHSSTNTSNGTTIVTVNHPVQSHVHLVKIEEALVVKVDIAAGIVRRVHFVLRQANRHDVLDCFCKCSQETGPTDVTAVHTQCTTDCVYLSVIYC